jgi:hypothetical protein
MSVTFTKLFSSITESTVWCESSDVRIVWIAMLAMADREGRVFGSIPGLANRARVPVEVCRSAINSFLSPDPDSRTKEHEGRRIQEIDGGWILLNHAKYRRIQDEEARRAYKAAHERNRRAKKAASSGQQSPSESPQTTKPSRGQNRGQNGRSWTNVDSNGHIADADADADADASTNTTPFAYGGKAPPHDANGDPLPPPRAEVIPIDPLGNREVYAIANLVAMASPYARLRSWTESEITHAHRVAVITAAKHEARNLGVSVGDAMTGLLQAVQHQTESLPPERLQFQGNIETYFREHTYRVEPEHLAGVSNGTNHRNASKGQRTADAVRQAVAFLAAGDADARRDGDTPVGGGFAAPTDRRLKSNL